MFLKDETLKEVTNRFEETFGRDLIDFAVNEQDGTLNVELNVPNGPLVSSIELNDIPMKEEDIEPEVKVKFIPFPVALPGDPELVWMMGKRETMSPDEAARALHEAQVEFWESKSGQLQLRKGAERTFPEFISRVPAKLLTESGLKRHYPHRLPGQWSLATKYAVQGQVLFPTADLDSFHQDLCNAKSAHLCGQFEKLTATTLLGR